MSSAGDATARRFYMVDLFEETRHAGNQLAVVVITDHLSEETMQRLAEETNYPDGRPGPRGESGRPAM